MFKSPKQHHFFLIIKLKRLTQTSFGINILYVGSFYGKQIGGGKIVKKITRRIISQVKFLIWAVTR